MVSLSKVISSQYPHWLYARMAHGEAVQDEHTGRWQGEQLGWLRLCRCREETSGRGSQIQAAGGEFISFSAIVQLPKGAPVVEAGTEVAVSDYNYQIGGTFDNPDFMASAPLGGSFRLRGICLKYDAGRLHSRLWV